MGRCKTDNPTALRSKRELKDALLSLMEERPLAQVSISQICARAQLTRPTFYNHFASKADIAAEIIDDAFDEFDEAITSAGIQSTEGMLKAFLAFWDEHQGLLATISDNGLLPLVSERFQPHLQRIYAASAFTDKTRDAHELAFHDAFLAAGMAGMLGEWARHPREVRAVDVAEYMENMLKTLAAGMERDVS